MHNRCTITTNIRGGILSKKSSETFELTSRKIPKKTIFSKVEQNRISTSGVKIMQFVKTIIAVNYYRKTLHRKCLEVF